MAKTRMINMEALGTESTRWLWPGRIPLGKLTLLVGDPGVSKSFLTMDVAARVSRGAEWPDPPASFAPQGTVVLLNAEDGLTDTVRPRLLAAQACLSNVVALAPHDATDASADGARLLALDRDLSMLSDALGDCPDCRLVIIDPISAYWGDADENRNMDVRRVLFSLAQLASQRDVAMLAVTHLNKQQGGRAIYRAMGSLAFVAAARSVWGVTLDPRNSQRRLMLPIKNNLASQSLGLAYTLAESVDTGTAHVVWEPAPALETIDYVLRAGEDRLAEQNDVDHQGFVCDWLREKLGDVGLPRGILSDLARRDGISDGQLHRASVKMNIVKTKYDFLRGWMWQLPDPAPPIEE
jgi:putative DNA primase/helicase